MASSEIVNITYVGLNVMRLCISLELYCTETKLVTHEVTDVDISNNPSFEEILKHCCRKGTCHYSFKELNRLYFQYKLCLSDPKGMLPRTCRFDPDSLLSSVNGTPMRPSNSSTPEPAKERLQDSVFRDPTPEEIDRAMDIIRGISQ